MERQERIHAEKGLDMVVEASSQGPMGHRARVLGISKSRAVTGLRDDP